MKVYTIGNLTIDVILSSLKSLPPWGTEIVIDNISYRVGGNLANLAFPLKKLEVDPIVIGNVGNDINGRFILNELNNSGISTSLIKIEEKTTTSTTISLVREDGERTLITYSGQLSFISKKFISDYTDKIQKNSIVMLCSLFQFPNLKIIDVAHLFRILKKKDCVTLLDTGWDPKGWSRKTISDIKKLLKFVDYFLPNLDEARVITGCRYEKKILKYLKNLGTENIITKKGLRGSIAMLNNKIIENSSYPSKCIDATGAGDAFNAGIIYCLKNEINSNSMLDFANALASIVVSKIDNRFPSLKVVNNLIK